LEHPQTAALRERIRSGTTGEVRLSDPRRLLAYEAGEALVG
jgi:hypothetical protein